MKKVPKKHQSDFKIDSDVIRAVGLFFAVTVCAGFFTFMGKKGHSQPKQVLEPQRVRRTQASTPPPPTTQRSAMQEDSSVVQETRTFTFLLRIEKLPQANYTYKAILVYGDDNGFITPLAAIQDAPPLRDGLLLLDVSSILGQLKEFKDPKAVRFYFYKETRNNTFEHRVTIEIPFGDIKDILKHQVLSGKIPNTDIEYQLIRRPILFCYFLEKRQNKHQVPENIEVLVTKSDNTTTTKTVSEEIQCYDLTYLISDILTGAKSIEIRYSKKENENYIYTSTTKTMKRLVQWLLLQKKPSIVEMLLRNGNNPSFQFEVNYDYFSFNDYITAVKKIE